MATREQMGESDARPFRASGTGLPATESAKSASDVHPAPSLHRNYSDWAIALMARDIAEMPGLDEALEYLASRLSSVIDFKRFSVLIRRAETDDYDRYYIRGTGIADDQKRDLIHLDEKFFKRFFFDGPTRKFSIEELNEVQKSTRTKTTGAEVGLGDCLGTCLSYQRQRVGLIVLRGSSSDSFSHSDSNLLERVASQVAGALANAQLSQLQERESAEKLALAEIGRIVGSTLDINEVAERTAAALKPLINFDRLGVTSVDVETMTASNFVDIDAFSYLPDIVHKPEWSVIGSSHEMAIKACAPFEFGDHNRDELSERLPSMKASFRAGMRSGITNPIFQNGVIIASLAIQSETRSAFSASDIALLENVAAQIGPATANAKLHYETQNEVHLRSALAEISRIVTSAPDLESTFKAFSDEARKIIRFDRVGIALLDQGGDMLEMVHFEGLPIPGIEVGFKIPLASSIAAEVLASRRAMAHSATETEDFATDPPQRHLILESGLNSDLIAPLIWRDAPIGALYFRSKEHLPYSDREVDIAEQIAAQISGAVENSRLHHAAKIEADRQSTLAEISRIVGSSLDIDDVYDRFAKAAAELIPFERVVVALIDYETETVIDAYVAGVLVEERPKGHTSPLATSIIGNVIDSPRSLIFDVDELLNDPVYGTQGSDLRSLLMVPLVWGDRVIGAINFRCSSPNAYQARHAEIAEQVAGQIAGAIATAEFHARTRRNAERETALAEIGRIVGSTLDIDEIYERFADAAANLIPFDRIVVALIDHTAGTVTDEYVAGLHIKETPKGHTARLDETIVADLVRNPVTTVFNFDDLKAEPRQSGALSRDLRSLLLVPLRWGDEIIGILNLRSRDPAAYNSEHASIAEQIGAQIAGAIANSILHEQTKRDAERQAMLAEIGRIVGMSLNVDEIFKRFAELAGKLIPYDRITVALVDAKANTITPAYVGGAAAKSHPYDPVRLTGSIAVDLIRDPRPRIYTKEDLQAEPSQVEALGLGLLSLLCVPLVWDDEVIGSIDFRSNEPAAYISRHALISEQIAAQIAGTVANAVMHERTKRDADRQAALAEIGRIVSSSPSMHETYERFAEQVRHLIPWDRIAINLIDEATDKLKATYSSGIEVPAHLKHFGRFVPGAPVTTTLVNQKAESFNEDEIHNAADQADGSHPFLDIGLRSVLAAPLVWHGKLIGVLVLRSIDPQAYSEDSVETAEQIVLQIAGAVANSRLHEQALLDAQRQTTLAEIGRIVGSTLDFNEVIDEFGAKSRELIDFDRVAIQYAGKSSSDSFSRHVHGVSVNDTGPALTTHTTEGTPAWQVFERGETVNIGKGELENLAEEFPHMKAYLDNGLFSLLAVPLFWRGQVVGSLGFRSSQESRFSDDAVRIAVLIAGQISGAYTNSHLHQELSASELEQAELAKLAHSISEASTLDEIYRLTDITLSRFFEHDRIAISLLDRDSMNMTAAFSRGLQIPVLDVGTVLELDYTIEEFNQWTSEITGPNGKMLKTSLIDNYRGLGIQSSIEAPLRTRDGCIGAIALRSLQPNAYTERDHELLTRIAGQVAPGIENLQLYAAAQKEANERAVLARLGRLATTSLDVTEILQAISDSAKQLISFDRFAIATVEDSGDIVRPEFVAGEKVDAAPTGILGPIDPRLSNFGPDGGGIVIDDCADDAPVDPSTGAYLSKLGLRSAISVTLIWDGQIIGLMTMSSRRPCAYSSVDLELAEKIAAQISGSVANAELHARSLQLASEREARIKLDAENRELQEIERERDRFISTISHELRTPLTSITAFSDLIARNKKGNLDEREMQQITLVRKNAGRLNVLINDLFDVTKINAGTLEITPEEFDVKQLSQELSESLAPMFNEKHQGLKLSLSEDEIWVNADRDRIAQVVSNLLSNASKYSPDSSQIELSISAKSNQVCISVTDQGIGISKRDQRLLFTPFFRAENEETRKVAGTGLGLVVTRSIVEMHGGRINVESTVGKGSRFEVLIPGARSGPSLEHVRKSAARNMPAQPGSRLDALSGESGPTPHSREKL